MRRNRLALATVVVVVALSLGAAGCSSSSSSGSASSGTSAAENNPVGDIPDNQVFVPYQPADGMFSVKVPEGWARTATADSVSYTDKLNTVTVQELSGRPEPTSDSVMAGELAGVVANGRKATVGAVERVTLPAGPAIHASYSADAAPDPVTGRTVRDDVELYVFWAKGTEVLLTLSGPHGADNVDPWRAISTSFTWNR
jgi:hypothetical protein